VREPHWKSYIVTTSEPVLTPQQCNEFIRIGKNTDIKRNFITASPTSGHRACNISWVPFEEITSIYQIIKDKMEVINNNYFGFDNIELFEPGQYTEYHKGGFYNWHIDHDVKMKAMPVVRKMSMTLLLNDPKDFEGGDLEIFCSETLDSKNNKVSFKQGHAVFFASFLLHRVIPITEGNRKALVMWFSGTPLR